MNKIMIERLLKILVFDKMATSQEKSNFSVKNCNPHNGLKIEIILKN